MADRARRSSPRPAGGARRSSPRPAASSPAGSTRRCAPSARSAARPTSSPAPRAPTSSTSTAGATLDYVQSWGASILGHAHPAVLEAIGAAAARGTTFGAPTEGEVRLAEVDHSWPSAGASMVRLVSSGTEAAMTAVRLARGATGRDRVVKFAGCYHGHSDALLAGGGSGVATLGLPGSAGVPAGAVAATLVAPYNDGPGARRTRGLRHRRAGGGEHGARRPRGRVPRGAARRVRRARRAALIFDEVITGFRLGRGGAAGGRGAAGPVVLRQGDRRRAAARRGRRPTRAHGAARAGRARLPGRHAVGQPPRHRGRARRPRAAAGRGLRRARGPRSAARRGLVGSDPLSRARRRGAGLRHALLAVLLRRPRARLRRGTAGRLDRALRPVLPRDARPRDRVGAEPVRGRLRVARPSQADIDRTIEAAAGAAARL